MQPLRHQNFLWCFLYYVTIKSYAQGDLKNFAFLGHSFKHIFIDKQLKSTAGATLHHSFVTVRRWIMTFQNFLHNRDIEVFLPRR